MLFEAPRSCFPPFVSLHLFPSFCFPPMRSPLSATGRRPALGISLASRLGSGGIRRFERQLAKPNAMDCPGPQSVSRKRPVRRDRRP
jgi:hypothetical protein